MHNVNKYILICTFAFLCTSTVYADSFDLEVPTPCARITHILKTGSNDDRTNGDVSTLQSFLQDQGYLSIDPTGYFGSRTSSALKKFQSRYKISPVGFVGVQTRKKIESLTCGHLLNADSLQSTNSTGTLSGLQLLPSDMLLQPSSPFSVVSPHSSSTVKMGDIYSVTWSTTDAPHVAYTVHVVGGVFGTTDYVIGRVPAGQKSIPWQIPASLTPGNTYRILIESEDGNRVLGQLFTLVPPDKNTPVIKNLSSTQGREYDKITISGNNFSSRVTLSIIQILKDNKVIAHLDPSIANPYAISIDGSQIHFVVDPLLVRNNPAGVYQLRVANPFGDGYAYSNVVNFTLVK